MGEHRRGTGLGALVLVAATLPLATSAAGADQSGETTLVVDPARIVEACTHLRDEQGFNALVDLSGVDYLGWGSTDVAGYIGTPTGRDLNAEGSQGFQRVPAAKQKRFTVVYHLLRVSDEPARLRRRVLTRITPTTTAAPSHRSGTRGRRRREATAPVRQARR